MLQCALEMPLILTVVENLVLKHFRVLCPLVYSLWQSIQRSRNYYKGHKEK